MSYKKQWMFLSLGLLGLIAFLAWGWNRFNPTRAAGRPEAGVRVETGTESLEIPLPMELNGSALLGQAIRAGKAVAWRNQLTAPVALTIGDGEFSSGILTPGQTAEYTFALPGTYTLTLSQPDGTPIQTQTIEVAP